MATYPLAESAAVPEFWELSPIATFPGMRCLAWRGSTLYASKGYELWQANLSSPSSAHWNLVAHFQPAVWRNITSRNRISSRLVRDGFHALAILPSGAMVAAVPGAILALRPGEHEFHVARKVTRGSRPLHIAATPGGKIYWGEYFDNPARDEVFIYGSDDDGATWDVAFTFHKRAIRHVHNILYDKWQDCLWTLTGDNGRECRILRASIDFRSVETVLWGTQQARAAAAIPSREGLYFSSDTPFERNHIYCLDCRGLVNEIAEISGSSIYGCEAGAAMFFSTMVEPSSVNTEQAVKIYGSNQGSGWRELLHWQKDQWPMKFFQYGNAVFPDGQNQTRTLALTTIGCRGSDSQMSLWQV